ncbi:hypothetical protein BT93_B1535 [Corymbia citriodora subsp. variegata]|nr:hypothetical protein BT93_B1535 [Corymbia citriodora subsp. variegata]
MAEAWATSVASNLVSKLGEYLIAPIGNQFGYVLCYKSYINDLKNRVKELETGRERVQRLVDEAMYDGKHIHTDIKNWLESVENKAKEAENLLKQGESAKIACFHRWLPNPMVRHPIGRKVKKMTRVIQGLHEKSQNSNFQKVYYENTPIGIVADATSAARSVNNKEDVLESRASIIEDLMKAIANDKVSVVGVHGPGGVGKSRLLEDVERRVKEEKLFDVVAKANISRNPDLKTIQGEIAYALGLKIMNEETARGRADLLCRRLESGPKKSILIILDNLWKKLELKEVGIPCRDDNKIIGCKLLLTSRYRDVLLTDMGSDQEFRLNKLKHGEARMLFERTVGDRVNNPDFEPLVDGVVKNCGGLPLLIISLAKRLKHGGLAAWRNALTNIEGSDVKSLVELNYNDLKNERIKSLFLACALDSGRISTRYTFVYCMGLGLFKKSNHTVEKARDRFIIDLQSLQDSSLVLDSDNVERFRMHDIFVEVAISIASTEWNALVGRKDYGFKEWSKDELRKCTAISFPHVGIDDLPKNLDCPNLRILLLLESHLSLEIPESFFESMEKLQVLDFSGFSFTSLPSSVEFLNNLKSLCLEYCHLEDLTIIGKLKGLQFLSLYRSAFTRLPIEIGELKELKYLDLRGCTKLKVIEPGMLESLVNLEELYIEDSFDQWEAEDEELRSNASLAELKNMKKLSTLYIAIPHSANLSRDLLFMKLNKHKIQVGDVWDWSGEYKESRTLKLKLDLGSLILEEWMQRCLQITEDLHLDGMQDGNDSIHDLCVEGFRELKHLHVQKSPSLQYIVHSSENVPCIAFSRLESLFLKNLNKMEKICHDCLSPESFSKLKIVKLDNCGEIKHLFPSSMKKIFLQLEEIEISRCQSMQQIVTDAKADEDGDEIDDDPKVKSCNLRKLTLQNLPEIMSFWKTMEHSVAFFNGQQVSLPGLESLTLSELPKLKEIWSSQFPLDMSSLKFLKVGDCTLLSSIIPSFIPMKLQNLEAITIERCQLIREVFDLEGLTASEDAEILSQLTKVTLIDLPSMGCIWHKNSRRTPCFRNLRSLKEIMNVQEEESEEDATTNTLEFPLLTSLSLEKLPNLKTFSYGKYYIHFPSLTRLRISECLKMMTFSSVEGPQHLTIADTGFQQAFGLINSGLSFPVFFNQKIMFPRVEDLTLSSLCGLRRIWHNELPEGSFCRLASITRFQSLKIIEVVRCTSLEALMEHVAVNTKKRQQYPVLLDLKELKLWHLPRLNAVVTGSTKVTLGLPCLTNVSLHCSPSLRCLFTNGTARTLDKLETLNVSDCNNMQEIVAIEDGEVRKLKVVKFSHLRTLKLCSLKSLITFSSRSCAYDLSILECTEFKAFMLRQPVPHLEMMNEGAAGFDEAPYYLFDEKVIFPKLEELHLTGIQSRELWKNEMPDEFICRLKVLEVKQCHNLLNVIPSFMWKRLLHYMESLTVESSNSIEGIYTLEGINVMEREAASSSQMRELSLFDLPNLTYVWNNEDLPNLCLHNLTSIRVEKCPRLRNPFTMSMAKSPGELKYLGLGGCEEMEYVLARGRKKPQEAAKQL